jgi:UDP-N-acetylmuramoylalanine--D-glutamate ligase
MSAASLQGVQRVAILGAGLEGQACWRWLAQYYPAISSTLFTNASDVELGQDLDEAVCIMTPVTAQQLVEFDLVVRSPGFSPYRAPLVDLPLLASGMRVLSATQLWREHWSDAKCIVITGTKGKSTVASLIAEMLAAAGIDVSLAGNIGRPVMELTPSDWNVLELSSYQLCDFSGRAELAVLTNLYPEHLDWHGGFERYRQDKFAWLQGAKAKILYANGETALESVLSDLGLEATASGSSGLYLAEDCLWDARGACLIKAGQWPLAGAHNRRNALLAIEAAMHAGAPLQACLQGLLGFQGLPHRFEVVAQRAGWRFINDSISTTPHATLAAVDALRPEEGCILLLGGQDRGVDWEVFYQRASSLPLLGVIGLGAGKTNNAAAILQQLSKDFPDLPLAQCADMSAAVSQLGQWLASWPERSVAVLLSPGAPSFDCYRDYRDRGEQFRRAAEALIKPARPDVG